MTLDPRCFSRLAQTLIAEDICTGDEEKIKYCTAVNRGYYAVFLRIREILDQSYGIKPQKQGEHFRIRTQLVGIMNRKDLFQYLKTLVNQRTKADYFTNEVGITKEEFEKFAKDSLLTAEYVLNQLDHY